MAKRKKHPYREVLDIVNRLIDLPDLPEPEKKRLESIRERLIDHIEEKTPPLSERLRRLLSNLISTIMFASAVVALIEWLSPD